MDSTKENKSEVVGCLEWESGLSVLQSVGSEELDMTWRLNSSLGCLEAEGTVLSPPGLP